MVNEPTEVKLKVTDVFEKLAVPYLIGGSLASTLYGMVRTTQDSDIIAEMRPKHIQRFAASLQNEFYIDEELKTRSGELDLDYLHKWANELRVSDLLERALKQGGT